MTRCERVHCCSAEWWNASVLRCKSTTELAAFGASARSKAVRIPVVGRNRCAPLEAILYAARQRIEAIFRIW